MTNKETEIFHAETLTAWRDWLEKNHQSSQSVWLVFYNKNTTKKSITWSEAVDAALCFGWIDSKKIKIDNETSHQFFSQRKAWSTWSKINKEKISRLTDAGLMSQKGLDAIEIARQNGSWTLLDEVEELIIPPDLEVAFEANQDSKTYFLSLSKSVKKALLQWIVLARQPATRQNRIEEIARQAAQCSKPKGF